MSIQLIVPSAPLKLDGLVSVLLNLSALADKEKMNFLRDLKRAPFVDPDYVVHDVSSDHVRILAQRATTLRDLVGLAPQVGIQKNIQVGRQYYPGNLDDSLLKLLDLANLHEANFTRRSRPRL